MFLILSHEKFKNSHGITPQGPLLRKFSPNFHLKVKDCDFAHFWDDGAKGKNYHTRAIITRGLYTFYPLFEVHLRTATFGLISIQERFLIKSGL